MKEEPGVVALLLGQGALSCAVMGLELQLGSTAVSSCATMRHWAFCFLQGQKLGAVKLVSYLLPFFYGF